MKAPKFLPKMPQLTSNEFCRAMYEVQTAKEVRALLFAAAASSNINDDIFLGCISQVYNCCPLERVNPEIYPACRFCDSYDNCDVYANYNKPENCEYPFNCNNTTCKDCKFRIECEHDARMEEMKEMLKEDNENV